MKTWLLFIGFILFTVFVSGCASVGSSAQNSAIVCEVFYRSEAGQSLEAAPLITFSGGNAQQTYEFGNMAFAAHFQDDEFEGRALSIAVKNLETDVEFTRQLYQFDAGNPVENQFVGGHGFTGLNYVFLPGSSAEMQFFCSVKSI